MTTATERLIHVGALLANCAYNLAQLDVLDEQSRKMLDRLRKEWDEARTAARALAAPADSTPLESRIRGGRLLGAICNADSGPVATPTNIKQEIFEAAVVAHGVRFVQKLPRPDIPSLEAIWVGVDKAIAAPRDDPAPDADLTDLAHEALSAAASAAHDLAGPQQRKEDKEARRALFDAIDARVPAPDAGTEALRDALGIGLDLATAEAAKARELYGSYPKDGLGRKCVAADADVATIERALAALSAADQEQKRMNYTDSDRFGFLDRHWNSNMEGKPVYAWLDDNMLRLAGLRNAVDFLMDVHNKATSARRAADQSHGDAHAKT